MDNIAVFLKVFESVGSVGLLGLLVFKAPEIFRAISQGIEGLIGNILKVMQKQTEDNNATMKLMLDKFDIRFLEQKEDMTKLVLALERHTTINEKQVNTTAELINEIRKAKSE